MLKRLRYLLLQVRNSDDPMRRQEVECFARALGASSAQIRVYDLLQHPRKPDGWRDCDVVLLGGSGHYSVAAGGDWLERALETMRDIHRCRVPTFASCWGFQAMARAMGGAVVHDLSSAEVGTHSVRLTDEGHADPVFGPLGDEFPAQMGHEDRVAELPPGATLLATSPRNRNQAYRFDGLPIYCTQFHPELTRTDLFERVRVYPQYVENIEGITIEEFCSRIRESAETEQLLRRFINYVF